MRAVAVVYRSERQAGRLDEPASEAAAQIIAWATRERAGWFWRGVGLPEHR